MSKRKRDPTIEDVKLLGRAVLRGEYARVRSLLRRGVKADCISFQRYEEDEFLFDDPQGYTALHVACKQGNLDILALLLMNDPDINVRENEHGSTPLQFACYYNHLGLVKLLIERGADIEASCMEEGQTPLHTTCCAGRLDICKFLIRMGANIDSKDSKGRTPVQLSMHHPEINKWLIESGASMHSKGRDGSILRWACALGRLEIIKCFKEKHSIDVNDKYDGGETLLHWVFCNDPKEIKNRRRYYAWAKTVGSTYIRDRSLKLAKFLVENGANVNAKNRNGKTPLHQACTEDSLELAQFLIKNGANINAKNNEGKTPLHAVFEYDYIGVVSHLEVVKLMIENGSDLNVADNDGKTALYFAIEYGHLDVVQFLVNRGANVDIKAKDGYTPLDVACNKNHLEIVWFLMRQFLLLVAE